MKAELPIPPPRITWRGVTLAGVGWVLYSFAFAAYFAQVVQIPFPTAVIQQLHGNSILALLSIPVWLLTVRRMDRAGWGWKIAVHALIAPLYAVCGFEAIVWWVQLIESDGEGGYVATLKNGVRVRVSRSRADQIRHLIV